ncbi:MAG TPA: RodZ domain-containing protein [Alphaproteobacteria bacterium]|jgi:cytoskeleton protein RodZ|nr:RodZ domain-containing protein [Alphaproteobacteria bacterium]
MSERESDIRAEHETQGLRNGMTNGGPTPSAVGAMLRATRQRYGWDLEDIEDALRIRLVHLQAIEDGRFEDLPGPAYAVGFVRAYAEHLGLDRELVVTQFRDEISDLPHRSQLNFPTPIPESRIPSGAIVLISLALAAAAYGGWYYLTMKDRGGVELVAEVPRQLAEMFRPTYQGAPGAPTPPSEAAASPATHEEAYGPAGGSTPTPIVQATPHEPGAASPAGGGTEPESANAEATPGTAEMAAAEHKPGEPSLSEQFAALPVTPDQAGTDGQGAAQVFGKANTNARIVILANSDSWVQVRDGEGALILTRMLRKGDSYRVPNKSGLTLLTGNAGALEIYVDGHKAPTLGPGGAIRRDVVLDADRLLAGTATEN